MAGLVSRSTPTLTLFFCPPEMPVKSSPPIMGLPPFLAELPAAERRGEVQGLPRRLRWQKGVILHHIGHLLAVGHWVDHFVVEADVSGDLLDLGGNDPACQNIEQRRLPGPAGPHQRRAMASRNSAELVLQDGDVLSLAAPDAVVQPPPSQRLALSARQQPTFRIDPLRLGLPVRNSVHHGL
eukprot:scaffold4614_cov247-Pinguiococcus_pyrenoidosus.AAC.5